MSIRRCIAPVLLGLFLSTAFLIAAASVGAAEDYSDDFDSLSSSWVEEEGSWVTSNGAVHASGSRPALIFDGWEGTRYVLTSRFSANDSEVSSYAQEGFYFYYEDDENYARVVFADDDRADKKDQLKIESKGVSFTNKKSHIDIQGNSTFEFSLDSWKSVKAVRLGREVYFYYQGDLAYTAEFEDSNPEGRVGYDVYASTGYFDDFYLEPIEMEDASLYEDEVDLSSGESWPINDVYSLSLREVVDGKAFVKLERFGESVGRTVVEKGDSVTLSDGEEDYVRFSVDEVFDTEGTAGKVWLSDVVSRESVSPGLSIRGVSMDSKVMEGGNVSVEAEVVNGGDSTISGEMSYSFSLGGESIKGSREVALGPGESEALRLNVSAPNRFGSYTGTLNVELQGQSVSKKGSVKVVTERPPVTNLEVKSSGGSVFTVEAVPGTKGRFIDWRLPYTLRLYRLSDSGKEEVYVEEGFFQSREREFTLKEARVPLGNGYYEAVLTAGGREAVHVLGDGSPAGSYRNDVRSDPFGDLDVYPVSLVLLVLGLVAVNGVKTLIHGNRSLPVEAVLLGGGAAASVILILAGRDAWTGGALLLVGVLLAVARHRDERVKGFFNRGASVDDYGSLLAALVVVLSVAVQVDVGFTAVLAVPLVYGAASSLWVRWGPLLTWR